MHPVRSILIVLSLSTAFAFTTTPSFHRAQIVSSLHKSSLVLKLSDPKSNTDGVVELSDDEPLKVATTVAVDQQDDEKKKLVAPFLSQSEELAEGVLNPDLSDPKQARVIIYIIISLLPVLFLIPLMLGSRELIPLDALPPVEM